ncbi:MAG: hypothetical protein WAV67_01530 [Dokdonella sp.]
MKTWVFLVGFVALSSGCATMQTMALKNGQTALNSASQSIVLMSVEVSRPDESRYEPVPTVLLVTDLNPGAKNQLIRFQLNKKNDVAQVDGRSAYLTSLALPPGRYRFAGIAGMAAAFPFIGNFFVPVVTVFEVKRDSVRYAGHVVATLSERREGEFRAGLVIPLIDQSATGMSTHSWNVVIDDRHELDIAKFRQRVSALVGVNIEVEVFPPWDRAAAQRRWEGQPGSDESPPK